MNISRRFLLLCALSSLAVPRSLSAERILLDGIAAKVNDAAITIGEVLSSVQPRGRELSSRYSGDALREKMAEVYRKEVNALVERQLILDAYEEQEGRIPEWAVEQKINEIVHEMFDDDHGALMNALAKDQRTYEAWKEDIRKQLIVASMRQNSVRRRISVSAADVYEVYRENPEECRLPVEVSLSILVLKKPDDEQGAVDVATRAEEFRQQLLEGADFGELARLHSQGTRAKEGGAWPWTETGDLAGALRDVIEVLPEGQISQVIDTDREVYLARVEERRGGGTAAFEEVREEIEKDLRQAEAKGLYEQWMSSLKKGAYIEVYDVNPFAD